MPGANHQLHHSTLQFLALQADSVALDLIAAEQRGRERLHQGCSLRALQKHACQHLLHVSYHKVCKVPATERQCLSSHAPSRRLSSYCNVLPQLLQAHARNLERPKS